jgi:hypothetical protein
VITVSFFAACSLFVLGWLGHTLVEARKQGGKFSFWLAYLTEHGLDQVLTAIGGIVVMLLWKYTGVRIPLPEELGGDILLVQGQYTAVAAVLGYLAESIIDKLTLILKLKK